MRYLFLVVLLGLGISAQSQQSVRYEQSLNNAWETLASDEKAPVGFEKVSLNTSKWPKVNIPHNWDQYEGYQRKLHGNKHGVAVYRKFFKVANSSQKRYFLYFEGVGSYATVWLNEKKVGYHAGGRTTFTLDVTNVIKLDGKENILAVQADHPANIRDLPWVDGGCSTERGFSEGSQPFGIFRPVTLIATNNLRIEPFGVHIWNDVFTGNKVDLNLKTSVKNYGKTVSNFILYNRLIDKTGKIIASTSSSTRLQPNGKAEFKQQFNQLVNAQLWSLENPYLYKVKTTLVQNGKVIDETVTPYGIRWVNWPIGDNTKSKQFLLNGKAVFINGIAEYEHLLGNSHAFTAEQIKSRVSQMKQSGFNAFRDGHQPHNLRYQTELDNSGILSWTQLSAHIWFDNPAFRKNFKELLKEWVIERRNSPSVVLWGLQNESTLPEDFAKECTELIRSLDPTASSQRKVTTCNGGKGTDWDVPQNWTGTYGGNPTLYGEDLKRQILVGEYGAWRTLDLHLGEPNSKADYSENYMSDLMETKVRLADSVQNEVAGHFFWLYSSHDNPGRVQGGEGLRDLDRIGPVNYKGMFTPWEEPTDVFYMFKANYTSAQTAPMVYVVSPTWVNRWSRAGVKDSIIVYSNCDEVELFNDVDGQSFGKVKRGKIGTHFTWKNINVQKNLLYAVGYVKGKAVAKHAIVLQNLPDSKQIHKLYQDADVLKPQTDRNYVYRYNCGGPEFKDTHGNIWLADKPLKDSKYPGTISWTKESNIKPEAFASQRRTFAPIVNSNQQDEQLFQTFRYGRQDLKFSFPLSAGEYEVELYFVEPWLGVGGGMDAKAMRLFDVAVNNQLVLKDLDIWSEIGTNRALKKTVKIKHDGGVLVVSFPNVKVAQALLSAIAISSNNSVKPAPQSEGLLKGVQGAKLETWMDIGAKQFVDEKISFTHLPPQLFGAEWLQTKPGKEVKFQLTDSADVFIALDSGKITTLKGFEDTKTTLTNSQDKIFKVFRKRFLKDKSFAFESNNEYTIAVTSPTNLQPAFDLKKVTSYKAADATLSGSGVKKGDLMDKPRAIFTQKSGSSITFPIQTGVADVYSLTLKYHNPTITQQKVKLELYDVGNSLLKSEVLTLDITKAGKWNYFNTSSGSMINAGAYRIVITSVDAEQLAVDAIDVQ